jgi:hypothetical protein
VFVCSLRLSQFIAIVFLKNVKRFAFALDGSLVRDELNFKVLFCMELGSVTRFPALSNILPLIHAYLRLHTSAVRQRKGRSLCTFENAKPFQKCDHEKHKYNYFPGHQRLEALLYLKVTLLARSQASAAGELNSVFCIITLREVI